MLIESTLNDGSISRSGGEPRVGVIIVAFNCNELLLQALQALASQHRLPDRIVVLDNASRAPLGTLPEVGGVPVQYIQSAVNTGFAGGNNLALRHLDDCDYVALLNPDAFPEPTWLATLLEAASKHPGYGSYASKTVCAEDPGIVDGAGDIYHASGLAWRRGFGGADSRESAPVEVFAPCAAAALYRADVMRALHGFDEDFFCYVEDVDLGFRLRLQGKPCLYVPTAVARHVGSATTGSRRSDFAVYHGHRNIVWTYIKNMPGILFWAFLPLHVFMNLLMLLIFVWRGQGATILSAKKDAIAGIPVMWRKRKQIQKDRVASVGEIFRALDKRLFSLRR
jgi:GT2 family glycosyltransferase